MPQFKDESQFPSWVIPHVNRTVSAGLMNGRQEADGVYFRGDDHVTRYELATFGSNIITHSNDLDDIDLEEMLRVVANCIVQVNSSTGLGSGFVISSQGHILTNQHVVGNDQYVQITWTSPFVDPNKGLPTGSIGPSATVLARDSTNDLALLYAGFGSNFDYVQVDHSWQSPVPSKFGKTVFTQGSPAGYKGRLSKGIFTGIRQLSTGLDYLDLAMAINPGNSGGALLTGDGKFVGITSNKLVALEYEGLGFAIPLSRILPFLSSAGIYL